MYEDDGSPHLGYRENTFYFIYLFIYVLHPTRGGDARVGVDDAAGAAVTPLQWHLPLRQSSKLQGANGLSA